MSLDNNSSTPLEDLIVAIADHRDKRAFEALFISCAPKLKGYAIQCGANSAEAEEIVQESLLTVWRKAGQFNPDLAKANTWLYTIVRNKRIDLQRKNQKATILSMDLWPEAESEPAPASIESDLNIDLVRKMLESLPKNQQKIVYKVYFEGKSHAEIADELGVPLGTVKSRLRLAMKKLDTLAKGQITWLIIILQMTF